MPDPMLQPVHPRLKFTLNFDTGSDPGTNPGAGVIPGVEAWRLAIPAKPACYLLCDANEQPILLATTGNLRNAMVHRLAEGVSPREEERDLGNEGMRDDASNGPASSPQSLSSPPQSLSSRTDYRAITRIIQYRPCCSAFETDWTFLENVRSIHPRNYRTLIRHWRTHWITMDPGAAHPRFTPTTQPHFEGELCIGPIAASADAKQTIDALEDLCDLCRHHDILVQAPHGIACAYKEMGKCPAPCDGSITMDEYRRRIDDAISLLVPGNAPPGSKNRDDWIARVRQQMKQAVAELRFEQAARWKLKLERLAALDHPSLRWCRPLDQWRGLYLQPGSRKSALRPFIITPGRIRFLGEITGKHRDQQIAWLQSHLPTLLNDATPPDELAAHRMALFARHLMRDNAPGRWLPADQPLEGIADF
ncbi:MAG: UvrB/UvrC motif-containing protein [Phycisphaeraceae bacterium]